MKMAETQSFETIRDIYPASQHKFPQKAIL